MQNINTKNPHIKFAIANQDLQTKLKQQEELTKNGKPIISTGHFGPIPPQPIPGGMSISA